MTSSLKPDMRGTDAALAHIDRMRKTLRDDFQRAMSKLDDDERDLLGLRKLMRDSNGNILGFDDESVASDEPVAWFRNYYRCAACGHEWQDNWSATCEDDCPRCGARHMTPFKSEDLPNDEPAS